MVNYTCAEMQLNLICYILQKEVAKPDQKASESQSDLHGSIIERYLAEQKRLGLANADGQGQQASNVGSDQTGSLLMNASIQND